MRAFVVDNESQTIRSILDDKILFFGADEFVEKVIKGDHCFICAAAPGSKVFNAEHIIPNWILRKFAMHNERITLPNGDKVKYGSYTLPCCQECNTLLSEVYEIPISKLVNSSYNDLAEKLRLKENHHLWHLLYKWLILIYFKVHLNDTGLPVEKDRRIQKGNLGDYYNWANKHHLHCMSRAHYTEAIINKRVYGSILILPALPIEGELCYDYIDNLQANTILLQVGDICFMAALDDSNACISMLSKILSKITGPLSPLQLREVFAHLTFLNLHLKKRPKFTSVITTRGYEIKVSRPRRGGIVDPALFVTTPQELLWFYAHQIFPQDDENYVAILERIKDGQQGFLFDAQGDFHQEAAD